MGAVASALHAESARSARSGRGEVGSNTQRPKIVLRLGANMVCSTVLGEKPHARKPLKQPLQVSNNAVHKKP